MNVTNEKSFHLLISAVEIDGAGQMKNDFLQMARKSISVLILTMSLSFLCNVAAQYRPEALRSGPSAGSMSTSQFERIDPYSGNMNFSLPLTVVSGRGSASMPLALTINQKWMRKERDLFGDGRDIYPYLLPIPTNESTDEFDPADYGYAPIYIPNNAVAKSIINYPDCNNTGNPGSVLTTITVTGSDGSHYELRDRASGGAIKPLNCPYPVAFNRGKIFDSIDGSGAVFIADSDIIDTSFQGPAAIEGKLITRDGLILRFGSTDAVTDRNGNKTTVEYQHVQVPPYTTTGATLTDSNGRQTQIEWGVTDVAPYGLCDRFSFLGFAGTPRYIRVSYKHLHDAIRPGLSVQTLRQMFPQWYSDLDYWNTGIFDPDNTFDPLLPATVWLPNGQSYSIYYNSYAEVARVVLPTGGAVEYDWAFNTGSGRLDIFNPGYLRTDEPFRRLVERRVYSDGSTLDNKTTYSGLESLGYGHAGQVTESLYDQGGSHLVNRTVHYFTGVLGPSESFDYHTNNPLGLEPWKNGKEYQTDVLDSDGTTLLRRSTQTWTQTSPAWWSGLDDPGEAPANNPVLSARTTTLADTNQVSGQVFAHDSFGNLTDTDDYDYGLGTAGPFLRRTHTDYLTTNPVNGVNYTSDSIHITDLPSETRISDAGNNTVSRTKYEYDDYNNIVNDLFHASLSDCTNITGHDSSFSPSFKNRGNLTGVTSYADAKYQTGAISTYSQYDIAGNVIKTFDARAKATSITYSDDFGAPDGSMNSSTDQTYASQISQLPAGIQTFAFPTSATSPLGYKAYTQFDYFSGALVDVKDINDNVSTTFYNDVLERPTQSISANNRTGFRHQTSYVYDEAHRKTIITSDLKSFGDNLNKSEYFYDAMGRTTESRSYESTSNYISVLTQYDTLGRAYKSSNPFRPYLSDAILNTTATFDSLGRVKQVQTADGAIVSHSYYGSTTTTTDQASKKRSGTTDAIGRLLKVNEDPDGVNLQTDYVYDVLGRLRKTTQTDGSTTQNRYFMYNDLGRLIRAKQVEQEINSNLNTPDLITGYNGWSVAYDYDNNGNLTSTTDALNRTISGVYDDHNRLTSRTYSDGTPAVAFIFDDPIIPNSKGKLTAVTSSVSSTNYTSFDELGRVRSSQQVTNGQTYNFSDYTYDLSGALVSQIYPSGRLVTTETDGIGRLSKVTSQALNGNPSVYLSDVAYTAFGSVESDKLGNGRWESTQYDPNRLQIKQIGLGGSAGNTNLSKIEYGYGSTFNNGTLLQQKVTVPGAPDQIVQDYTYDSLNRLHTATETVNNVQSWKQTFSIDRFGNRRFDPTDTTTIGSCSQAVCNPNIDQTKNRLSSGDGYVFDSEGNLTVDQESHSFSYDGENRIKQVLNTYSLNTKTFQYDGLGKRVRQTSDAEDTIFVYDAFGKLVAEFSTEISQSPKIAYLTADSLGSPRLATDALGQVISRHDYMAYGEEIASGVGGRTPEQGYAGDDRVRQKFTGYERDDDSDLDFAQARYFSSKHGRFTTVDPMIGSANVANPQTFNRYSYGLNSPYNFIDPLGLSPCSGPGAGTDSSGAACDIPPDAPPCPVKDCGDYTYDSVAKKWIPPDDLLDADGTYDPKTSSRCFCGSENDAIISSVDTQTPTQPRSTFGNEPGGGPLQPRGSSAAQPRGAPEPEPGGSRGGGTGGGTATVALELFHCFFFGPCTQKTGGDCGDDPGNCDKKDDIPNIFVPRSRFPEAAAHIIEAQSAGQPSIVTIDRPGAAARRRAALAGFPARDGFQRDEYPMAVFVQGGSGASVRYIDPSDNQGAGAYVGNQLRPHPNGTRVRIVVIP